MEKIWPLALAASFTLFFFVGVGDSALSKFIGWSMEAEKNLEEEKADDSFVRGHEEQLLKILLQKIGSSEFLKKVEEDVVVPTLEPCCRQLLADLKSANVFEVAFLHPQGPADWMKERQLRITGSTCYEIYWESKSVNFFPKSFTNKFVRHGLKYEKDALEVFRRQSNTELITPLIISNLFPWLGFSPDGVIFEEDNPVALLEIKCPYTGLYAKMWHLNLSLSNGLRVIRRELGFDNATRTLLILNYAMEYLFGVHAIQLYLRECMLLLQK